MAKHKVFLSYNWKDRQTADLLKTTIEELGFHVWIDHENIEPGDRFSDSIADALTASDYFVVVVSENSTVSKWVKTEVARARKLADEKKLSAIPLLMDHSDVPIEFEGLKYIDFRTSFASGLKAMVDFFRSQLIRVGTLDARFVVKKSADDREALINRCETILRVLDVGGLRRALTETLSFDSVEVLWFDLFERKMSDEVRVPSLALATVELVDRARRERDLPKLLRIVCENHCQLFLKLHRH